MPYNSWIKCTPFLHMTSSKRHKGTILTRILAQYNVINEREHLDVHHIRVQHHCNFDIQTDHVNAVVFVFGCCVWFHCCGFFVCIFSFLWLLLYFLRKMQLGSQLLCDKPFWLNVNKRNIPTQCLICWRSGTLGTRDVNRVCVPP